MLEKLLAKFFTQHQDKSGKEKGMLPQFNRDFVREEHSSDNMPTLNFDPPSYEMPRRQNIPLLPKNLPLGNAVRVPGPRALRVAAALGRTAQGILAAPLLEKLKSI